MDALLARAKEPSTHAAIAGVLAALIPLMPPEWQWLGQGLALVFGGAGVVKREGR